MDTAPDISVPSLVENRFLDRELSWLHFNTRVLELAEDQREAFREVVEASVLNAYTDFLNSMFSYYRGSLDEAQRSARQ